jgi:hypothetical protein
MKEIRVMALKGFAAIVAALALTVLVPAPAEAYPTTTTTRSGTTTVTGTYRPVDLTLSVVPTFGVEASALTISAPTAIPFVGDLYGISLTLFLQGSWEGVGYGTPVPQGDDAGTWKLSLDLVGVRNGSTMSAYALDNWPVGTLDLVDVTPSSFNDPTPPKLTTSDTPKLGDRFLVYTRPDCASDRIDFLACRVLQLDLDAIDLSERLDGFDATLFDALTHVGPFVPCTGNSAFSRYSCNYHYDQLFAPTFPFVSPLFQNPIVEDYRLDGGVSGRTSYINGVECRPGSAACSAGTRGISTPAGVRFASSEGLRSNPTDVPVPGTLALVGIGLLGFGLNRRRRA